MAEFRCESGPLLSSDLTFGSRQANICGIMFLLLTRWSEQDLVPAAVSLSRWAGSWMMFRYRQFTEFP